MPKKSPKTKRKNHNPVHRVASLLWSGFRRYWHRNIFNKIVTVIVAIVVLFFGVTYGIAQWYIASQADKPIKYGLTFIPSYARSFGLDPKETMSAMIDDLGIRQFRLVSYWNEGEPVEGQYDFTELDWQFKLAEESGSKVSLAIGLRQPRWPECHWPQWAQEKPMEQWSQDLKRYMGVVIERYQDSPALESYQLENEFFLSVFGICPDFTRERLIDEYEFVKSLDSEHPIIVSRSNNIIGFPINEPVPDVSAVSVYKRVWDKYYTHRYLEYPFPAWFYGFLAGGGKILNGKDMILHELQAEPWLPEGFQMNDVNDIPEQMKSMDAERMKHRIQYGQATGVKEMYLWGAEWWYWLKVKGGDSSVWDTVKTEIHETN